MSRSFFAIVGSASLLLAGCTETPVSTPLRSLEGSDDVSFVCLGPDGSPRSINDCPDVAGDTSNHMYALVTQEKGEVAVIDLSSGGILDVDPSTPGFTFLHVGAVPRDIVSTPGGAATFVGVGEVGREGIFALPSSCLGRPTGTQSARDLTTWPACRLPSEPGSMAILIDPPDASGQVREICPGAPPGTDRDGAATAGSECPADLTREPGPVGRRKLAVAMPLLGRIDIYDAQAILNRPPGTFQNCDIDLEQSIPLRVDLPAKPIVQRLPADLQGQAPGCGALDLTYPDRPNVFVPQPAGFALGGDTLYVGDSKAPVIHVLGVADPCAAVEYPAPLLPLSFLEPGRVVVTTEVALSPLTPRGKRFVYAIDKENNSVMAFDVTRGATDRTPIVRPGSLRQPEPPDRIRFASAPQALAFGLRNLPKFDPNGVSGDPYCDPNPAVPLTEPGAQYRPSLDRSTGAGPANLRGIFGFIMLKNGEVQVIDVDDFDAACRRPVLANPDPVANFQGCKNDPAVPGNEFRLGPENGARPTVSDEVSCGVVQPHRSRGASFVLTNEDNGARAPTLRTLPRFTNAGEPEPDRSVFPKLLAVDYPSRSPTEPVRAQVFVGTELFTSNPDEKDNKIDIDPVTAKDNSLVLPWVEPRSYAPADDQALTYEGVFGAATRTTGRLDRLDHRRLFDESNGRYCGSGVQDERLAREWGQELGLTRDIDLDAFAHDHADYVQITSAVLDRNETFWQTAEGAACGNGGGFNGCVAIFGTTVGDILNDTRDLRIVEAFDGELFVEPRNIEDPAEQQALLDNVACCFPTFFSYRTRGSKQWILTGNATGFRRNVVAQRDGTRLRCVRDCRPGAALQKARAIEIPAATCDPDGPAPCPPCSLKEPLPADTSHAVNPDRAAMDRRAACIFESPTARFVVFQGIKDEEPFESRRDTKFEWTTTGGFIPLRAALTSQTATVSPVSMVFVPQLGQLAVVDGAAAGLSFISLETIGVSRLFF